jgi:hypothetical protein
MVPKWVECASQLCADARCVEASIGHLRAMWINIRDAAFRWDCAAPDSHDQPVPCGARRGQGLLAAGWRLGADGEFAEK